MDLGSWSYGKEAGELVVKQRWVPNGIRRARCDCRRLAGPAHG